MYIILLFHHAFYHTLQMYKKIFNALKGVTFKRLDNLITIRPILFHIKTGESIILFYYRF